MATTETTKKKTANAGDGPLGPIRLYVLTADVWDQVIDRDTPGAYATAKDPETGRPMAWAVDGAIEHTHHPLTKRPLTFALVRKKGDVIALPERHADVVRLGQPRGGRGRWTGRAVLELAGEHEANELAAVEARQAQLEQEREELNERIAALRAELDSATGESGEAVEIREAPHDPSRPRLT